MTVSWLQSLVALPADERAAVLADVSEEACEQLLRDWEAWARPEQIAPVGDWTAWAVVAGRGFGKTRTGAEWVRAKVEAGTCAGRIAIVGPTAADVRDVMVEGESGLLSIYPKRQRPVYQPSNRRVRFYNGAIGTCYSADEPDRLRGPQHGAAWADEIAAWRYADAWDMLMMGLRLGDHPQVCATTTPRPIRFVRELLSDPTTVVTRGSTYDNQANLAVSFINKVIKKYEGTRLGRQELLAEMLDDTPGALWTLATLDSTRVTKAPANLARVVVGVDPAASSGEDSDETGIIVGGIDCGEDDPNGDAHGYVLEDCSGRMTPSEWGHAAVNAFRRWKADRIVVEANNGGDMAVHVIATVDPNIPVVKVWASRGKVTRAEPIAALYEQGRIHHVGHFAALESQQTTYVPNVSDESPDRMDADVWCFTDLMLDGAGMPGIRQL